MIDVLRYIEKMKEMYEGDGPRTMAQEPRTMLAKANIPDAFDPDLEQSEFLRPGETLETWKPNPFLKPHADGGIITPPEKPKLPQLKIFADRLQTYVKAGAIKKVAKKTATKKIVKKPKKKDK